MWPNAREELRRDLALLPSVHARLDGAWDGRISMSDASPCGFRIVDGDWYPLQVAAAGPMRERLRFRAPLAREAGPRERALERMVACLGQGEAVALGAEAGFVELPASLVMDTQWEVVA